MKGNVKSNRICVYLTGANSQKVKKLLGIPDSQSGTGETEAEVVIGMLASWNIRREVTAMVFDTTSSNSGANLGSCRYNV